MDPKAAVMNYQFGERAKSELIVLSQLCIALPSFPEGGERAGGKKMLLLMMESVRSEIQYAATSTGHREFQNAASSLSLAISLVESDKAEEAAGKIAQAISASTTPAQEAWQVLSEHGLL
jgi:hypothetical protein